MKSRGGKVKVAPTPGPHPAPAQRISSPPPLQGGLPLTPLQPVKQPGATAGELPQPCPALLPSSQEHPGFLRGFHTHVLVHARKYVCPPTSQGALITLCASYPERGSVLLALAWLTSVSLRPVKRRPCSDLSWEPRLLDLPVASFPPPRLTLPLAVQRPRTCWGTTRQSRARSPRGCAARATPAPTTTTARTGGAAPASTSTGPSGRAPGAGGRGPAGRLPLRGQGPGTRLVRRAGREPAWALPV